MYPIICELFFPGCSLCIWVGVSCSCRKKSWTAAKPASKDAESTGDYWNDPCSCCLLFFWSPTLNFCQKDNKPYIFPACHFHLHLQNDLFCFLPKSWIFVSKSAGEESLPGKISPRGSIGIAVNSQVQLLLHLPDCYIYIGHLCIFFLSVISFKQCICVIAYLCPGR